MSNKNKKGFSLAELLISLLIISLVLSAAIPTITKRSGSSREQIWHWVEANSDIFYGTGEEQTAILGFQALPASMTYFFSQYGDEPTINADADKLAIFQQIQDGKRVFEKSQIGFYTVNKNSGSSGGNDIKYAGRLALDRTNMALGIGSLQSLENNVSSNTALGHYALYHNDKGGSNTAVGYYSLANLSRAADTNSNKANTAIGMGACSSISNGSNNICLGNYSGYDPNGGEFTVKPGIVYTNNISNRIFIGNNNIKTDGSPEYYNADIITGYTYYLNGKYDKELDVNTKKFQVRTFDGMQPMFSLIADRGSITSDDDISKIGIGYNNTQNEYKGKSEFKYYINGNSIESPASKIETTGSGNEIRVKTFFASSASDPNLKKYKGSININDNALSYQFTDSTKDPTKKKYKVEMSSDYELGISSLNSSVDIGAKDEMNLIASSSTPASAGILLSSTSTENKIEVKASNNDFMKLSSKTDEGFKVSTNQKINLFAAKDNNISGKSVNIATSGKDDGNDINLSSERNVNISSKNASNISLSSAKDINLITTDGKYINIGSQSNHINIVDRKIDNVADVMINNLGSVKTKLNELLQNYYSDIRLKENISDNNAGLKEINELKVKNYTYKDDKEKISHVGVIAQDLQKVFPNSVTEDKNTGFLKIRKEEIFYAMVNSIKELFSQLQELTAKITGLDKRITELEKENQMLKKQNEDFEKRLSKLESKK